MAKIEPIEFCEEYLARWNDESYPEGTFLAVIARLDKPENRAYWDSLTDEERELEDNYVFYYVYQEGEIESLFNDDHDFKLIGEA